MLRGLATRCRSVVPSRQRFGLDLLPASKQVQGEGRVGNLVSHLSNACTVWHAQHQRCESAKTLGLGLVCRVGYEARPGFQHRAMSHEGTVVNTWARSWPARSCLPGVLTACTCCHPPVTAARVTSSWQVRVAPAAGRKGSSSAFCAEQAQGKPCVQTWASFATAAQ